MSYEYSEDGLVEAATKDVLEELGWTVVTAWKNESFGEDGLLGRENKSEVVLTRYLLKALEHLNPNLPQLAYDQAIALITQNIADQTLGYVNKHKSNLLKQGVPVSYTNDKGELIKTKLKVFDFSNYRNNDFLAVRQLEVLGELYLRRPDVIGFVNGIPLVFFELKAHHQDLRHAYTDNLKDYKDTISQVFHNNAFVILSNGTDAKVGTITSPYKYFLDWKRIEEDEEGEVSLDTMLRGTCDKHRFMDIFENFLLFDDSHGDVVKLMAKNHQYIGVNKVIENVNNIEDLEGKLGVFWHTQGSGKSYSMVFLCEKIHRKLGGSYTFLIAVDRTELENQLYDTFSGVGVVNDKNVIAGKKKGMTGREHLRELLSENHRYVFTLIHKFSIDPKLETEYPLITDRKNVIVISDEAHRTQSGTYARNMRFHGLPNASYLGFTGTPIIKEEEELTKNIFGEYVSVYDFKRAIEDEATLPLRYLNRGEKLDITNPELDEQMAAVFENEDLDDDQKKKLEYLFSRNYPILTAQPRLEAIAKDLVWHFNERGYQGKAMYVALDKPTAVRMYELIQGYWPEYLKELEERIKNAEDEQDAQELKRKYNNVKETEVCVVVSSEQNEVDKFRKMDLDIEIHRRKMVERNLEKEFKDEDNPFRLAIVCAMWITGFDAPCVSTVYLDKPIKGHTLMQTIARANRVYDDEKENGLIVDYGNVYKQLEQAYSVYGEGGKSGGKGNPNGKPVEPLEDVEIELKQAIKDVKTYLKELSFSIQDLKDAKPMSKIAKIKDATDCVCLNETTRTTFEMMARNVFRKYKALFPSDKLKKHEKDYNAIEAIYTALNQNVKSADVTQIIMDLQAIVSDSIVIKESEVNVTEGGVYVDLSVLDFDKLRAAFAITTRKNTLVFNLQNAIETRLEQMLKENPLRIEFYERYKEIIDEYNKGKSLEDTVKTFDNLNSFIQDLSGEEQRVVRENLKNQETLAIFDLLREGKNLSEKELKEVKKVAAKTLDILKTEKLKFEKWRESRQIKAQVKSTIYDNLLYLPQDSYSDEEVGIKTANVYQHIYTNYSGGGNSVYSRTI
ncbi:type I restriction endonuclease subunit R [Formosa algae]|uniref:Type I restriction enzyme endonuclease subunit n=1 Tax=Formosa algae TaxID=225843 RepID=A0A9X0YND0_9FLAO|nr:type I restriction endonuclease subunit R [Formosa algae]MBP1840524.1 type I restriction enzyme R subunit [Formosa algae]MDQ0336063.1 type I restriction enzyme R subunit [Formosa algae]OEI81053.1 deoxyribonuclease HsdR [Formosa algae]